jgi:hypothetical protein
MTRAGSWIGVAVVIAASGAGCDSPSTPAPAPPRTIVRPIQVDSVEVALAPPSAHVRGVIGDGCTELSGVSIARSENNVTVTIFSTRPEGAICIQIAKLYDAVLVLPGDYPPGQYVLRVNSVEKTFTVP